MTFFRRNYRDLPFDQLTSCGHASHDGSLTCTRELGHLGWHTHTSSDTSWYLDSWAVDEYADTAEAAVDPEPTMSADEWARLNQPPKPGKQLIPTRPTRRERKAQAQTQRLLTERFAISIQNNYKINWYRTLEAEAKRRGTHRVI